jgi:hypothetical protein
MSRKQQWDWSRKNKYEGCRLLYSLACCEKDEDEKLALDAYSTSEAKSLKY